MDVIVGEGDPKKVTVAGGINEGGVKGEAGGINEEGVKGEAWKGEKEDF